MLLIYRMLATLLALSISRWMLYLFNIQFFHQLSFRQAAVLYFYGKRFDLPIVLAVNLLNIIFYCFPSRIIYNQGLQKFVDFVYVVANAVAVLALLVKGLYDYLHPESQSVELADFAFGVFGILKTDVALLLIGLAIVI